MPGPVFLDGDQVALRTVEKEDAQFLQETINDPGVREYLTIRRPINGEQEAEYFEEVISDESSVSLLIAVDGEPVGSIGLQTNQDAGHAEIGISLATAFHGNGYGTEASRLITDYAFDELRMHRVFARVLGDNVGSHRIWEKLGFTDEGVLRDAEFIGGEYVDVAYYGVLEHEWRA